MSDEQPAAEVEQQQQESTAPPPAEAEAETTAKELEKQEEAKLKAKFPTMPAGRFVGHSAFLQKRLAKGQKFFDSGDYQMAKQKTGGLNKLPLKVPDPFFQTGEAIPTPETVPARKTSLVQPSKLTTVSTPTGHSPPSKYPNN